MKKRFLTLLLALSVATILWLLPVTAQDSYWQAQYYDNPDLQGNPVATQFEVTPSDNWGLGSPHPNVPVNNWSARWTKTMTLGQGQYRFSAEADDGVRIYLNGDLIIDEWHGHYPETYTAEIGLIAGTYTVVIEFFDGTSYSYLNYGMQRTNSQELIYPGQSQVRLTAPFAYIRNQPNSAGLVVGTATQGAIYTVYDVQQAGQWYQISYNGQLAWIDSGYVSLISNQQTSGGGNTINQPIATVTADLLNVRNVPDPINGSVIAQVRRGETYPAVKTDPLTGWVQINVGGTLGWVNENYVSLQNQGSLPVGDQPAPIFPTLAPPTPTPIPQQDARPPQYTQVGTVQIDTARLNVRALPSSSSDVIFKVNEGEEHPLIGTDSTGRWLQIDADGAIGWVGRFYVDVESNQTIPIVNDIESDYVERNNILVRATPYNVNIRTGPGTSYDDIATFRRFETAQIIGRTSNNTWWQIRYNGITGWVSSRYARVQANADINSIPITNP